MLTKSIKFSNKEIKNKNTSFYYKKKSCRDLKLFNVGLKVI